MNMLLLIDFCKKLSDILNELCELAINSEFGTDLKDLRVEQKYRASRMVVLPALFSPESTVIGVWKSMLYKLIERKFWMLIEVICTTIRA